MRHPLHAARLLAPLLLTLASPALDARVLADANEGSGSFASSEATISAGGTHTCALLRDGGATCWGSNKYQELGDRTLTLNRSTPVLVTGIDGATPSATATQISSGDYHTCLVLETGAASCWGYNIFGQLGDGTLTSRLTATTVWGLDGGPKSAKAVAISAGSDHTCAVLSTGGATCWGNNSVGRLGNENVVGDSSTPVPVTGIDGSTDATFAVAISASSSHTCALMRTGAIRCWGYNGSGELGDDTTVNRSTPVLVLGVDGSIPSATAVAISVGSSHSCAVMRTGGVMCWGFNAYGKLGDATTVNRTKPVPVSGLGGANDAFAAVAISAGDAHTCAVLTTGRATCWGYNAYGELGNANTATSSIPVAVSGVDGATASSSAVAISVGVSHTCAVLKTGHVTCWGYNGTGELGDDTIENRSKQREVSRLSLTVATARRAPIGGARHASTSAASQRSGPGAHGSTSGLTPTTMALLGAGLVGLAALMSRADRRPNRRRNRRKPRRHMRQRRSGTV